MTIDALLPVAFPAVATPTSPTRARVSTVVTDRSDPAEAAVEAVERLYLEQWDRMVRLSYLLVRDQGQAEEIVQDSLIAVHQHWDRIEDHHRAVGYLRQSVVNRSRSALRHRGVVQRFLDRQSAPTDAAPADGPALAADQRRIVLDALGRLPRRQREVLVLRYYLDLSEAEIAETLGISRGAVKSHASRGSAALRDILDRLGNDTSEKVRNDDAGSR